MERPENLISEEKMVDVLTELSILHGTRTFDRRSLEKTGLQLEQYLFEKYDIDSVQFAKANAYYVENPSVYVRIYDSVKARLETLKVKYETLKLEKEEQERIADSLRNIEKDTLATEKIKDSLPEKETSLQTIPSEDSISNEQ